MATPGLSGYLLGASSACQGKATLSTQSTKSTTNASMASTVCKVHTTFSSPISSRTQQSSVSLQLSRLSGLPMKLNPSLNQKRWAHWMDGSWDLRALPVLVCCWSHRTVPRRSVWAWVPHWNWHLRRSVQGFFSTSPHSRVYIATRSKMPPLRYWKSLMSLNSPASSPLGWGNRDQARSWYFENTLGKIQHRLFLRCILQQGFVVFFSFFSYH